MATNNPSRLYRSTECGMIAGVCAGLADFFGLDVARIRIAALLLVLFGGLSIWAYIILWIIIPRTPKRLNP